MKELSIEQKAKRYDVALEKIHQFIDGYSRREISKEELEDIFPELKESEDEKVRKALIKFVQGIYMGCCTEGAGKERDMFLAWLEKQGNLMKALQISNAKIGELIEENYYLKEQLEKQGDYNRLVKEIKECKELFSKEKKKAVSTNDKLSLGGRIAMLEELLAFTKEKQGKQKPADKAEPKFHEGDWLVHNERKNIVKVVKHTPFVYVVVDILGYHNTITNDAIENNYHLWTIKDAKDGDVLTDGDMFVIFKSNNYDPNTQYGCMFVYCSIMKNNGGWHESWYESGGHNPTYYLPATKEQRDILFARMKEAGYEWDAEKKELKKIEERIADNIPQAFEKYVEHLLSLSDGEGHGSPAKVKDVSAELFKLAKLKQKHTWSEEDERMYRGLHNLIYSTPYCDSRKEFSDWFKTFKERYTWKPSAFHLECIEDAIGLYEKRGINAIGLKEILEELKKLRKE